MDSSRNYGACSDSRGNKSNFQWGPSACNPEDTGTGTVGRDPTIQGCFWTPVVGSFGSYEGTGVPRVSFGVGGYEMKRVHLGNGSLLSAFWSECQAELNLRILAQQPVKEKSAVLLFENKLVHRVNLVFSVDNGQAVKSLFLRDLHLLVGLRVVVHEEIVETQGVKPRRASKANEWSLGSK
jgi:hypothetical protein